MHTILICLLLIDGYWLAEFIHSRYDRMHRFNWQRLIDACYFSILTAIAISVF